MRLTNPAIFYFTNETLKFCKLIYFVIYRCENQTTDLHLKLEEEGKSYEKLPLEGHLVVENGIADVAVPSDLSQLAEEFDNTAGNMQQ